MSKEENMGMTENGTAKKKKSIFKRWWFWVLIIIIVAIIVAMSGGSDDDNSGDNSKDVSGVESDDSGSTQDITLDEQVVYEKDGITVTVKSIDTEDFWGPAVNFEVSNDTDKNIIVSATNVSVNDIMIDQDLSCEVASGKKDNSDMTFYENEMEVADIEKIKDIEFNLCIYDSDTWDEIDTSDVISLTTNGSEDYVQQIDNSGTSIVDQDGVKMVVKKLDSEDSFWGADIYVYVENNTDDSIVIQADNVSINGYMVDPTFSCDVMPGKKAFDTITFFDSDLEDNGIEDITELEATFNILDGDSYLEKFSTSAITITFE